MANNKMLIDAGHPEETRVAMVRGNRVDEFDFESEHKTQLRGNIYLAKVTRVEPSLQAAFVDYGGNRHGFLAFSEIHPDYYQIPMADRQALLEAEAEDARAAAAEEDTDDEPEALESKADAVPDEEEAAEEQKPARKKRTRRRTKRKAAADDSNDADDEPASDEAPETDVAEESDSDDDTMAADNDGDDVVSEPAEEPEKPKRRTTRRKAPAAKAEDAADPANEEKPQDPPAKPKRKRRTKAQIEADRAAEEAAKAEKEAAAAEASDAKTQGETEEKPKPKRRRASRKKKEAEGESADEQPKDDEAAEPANDTPNADAPQNAASDGDGDGDNADNGETDEDKPKKAKSSRSRGTRSRRSKRGGKSDENEPSDEETAADDKPVEEVGSEDAMEEVPARRAPRRHYKIQEVIKRRQILLVQVVKEERGNKGAALTTYLSLAGRYSVLMPNTARGGGISRKITNSSDRKRLKSIASGLEVPQGMGVILRTAGASRAPEEIQRDFEYLMRLWENVRTLTLESTAPCLVYEEGSLIKRSIRDLYDKDTGEILVAGEAGYREAKDFMTMLMPEHAKNVKEYKDRVPLFARMGVETQLDAMLQPQVTLKSGGYIIIDQTEALVAIDVNSGRSTRQHSIEETAYQTNLEAADEVARQLRLRDLA
ncbi:MAG: ribonuclease E/G, partial [Pseudomonadota bacterium]